MRPERQGQVSVSKAPVTPVARETAGGLSGLDQRTDFRAELVVSQ